MKTVTKTHSDRWGRIWYNTYGNMWETQKTNRMYEVGYIDQETQKNKIIAVAGTSSTLKHIDDIFW